MILDYIIKAGENAKIMNKAPLMIDYFLYSFGEEFWGSFGERCADQKANIKLTIYVGYMLTEKITYCR
ncbi:hypothetical protein ACS33_15895 [Edwardsiella ictaluri]|uniref:hypothetical protein n=2 Tax=Edwardsiella ictaluri TaxID=67780 RepID=UPI00065D3DE7|nr:hypothetical protein [Edwardsiella ictaluri]KMQ77868.1 hypothetical protein ABY58_12255 [Edwardsiella ictaluri]KOO54130.1 hypothetical protein ACS33_15895 [Edwardsiella ictaluri]